MRIVLYNNKSGNNVVDKTLVSDNEISGVFLKNDTSIINPVFLLSGFDVSQFTDYNYLYVPSFHRYYFIENFVAKTGKIVEISAHVDVLMTYKSDILASTQMIERQQNKANNYIIDNSLPLQANRKISYYNFGEDFDNVNFFVLAIANGLGGEE